jgi:hypothetical protein
MKYISLLFLLMLFSSCESFFDTVVEIDPPGHDPQLAIHAHGGNTNGGEVKLMVTRTFGILDDVKNERLDSAVVSLTSSGGQTYTFQTIDHGVILYDTLILSNDTLVYEHYNSSFNLYSSDFMPEVGKIYTLSVSYPGLPTIRAQQTFPREVVPDSAIFVLDAGIGQFGERVSAVDIYFQDPPLEENFYKVRLLENSDFGLDSEYIESSEPGSIVSDQQFIILSDKVFDGEHKRFRITFYNNNNDDEPNYLVRWRSISAETFKFNEAMTKYFNSVNNPFLTPTQIYTNIENGVGIFSLYHETLIEAR